MCVVVNLSIYQLIKCFTLVTWSDISQQDHWACDGTQCCKKLFILENWLFSHLFKMSAQTSYTISVVCAKFCHNSVWISESHSDFEHWPLDSSSSLSLNVKGPGMKKGKNECLWYHRHAISGSKSFHSVITPVGSTSSTCLSSTRLSDYIVNFISKNHTRMVQPVFPSINMLAWQLWVLTISMFTVYVQFDVARCFLTGEGGMREF